MESGKHFKVTEISSLLWQYDTSLEMAVVIAAVKGSNKWLNIKDSSVTSYVHFLNKADQAGHLGFKSLHTMTDPHDDKSSKKDFFFFSRIEISFFIIINIPCMHKCRSQFFLKIIICMRRMLKSSRPNHEGIPEMVLMFGHLVRDFRKWDRPRIFAPPSLYKSEILKSFFKKVVVHLKYPRLTNYFRLFKKYPKLPDLILKIFFFFLPDLIFLNIHFYF